MIDLYAGSGALGIEALSRGAASCVFVDVSRDACRTIGANLEKLGLRATVLCQDALRALAAERGPYDLILADPPYDFTALRAPRAAPRPPPRRPTGSPSSQTAGRRRAARSRASTVRTSRTLRLRAPYAVRAVITAICPGSFDPVTNGHVDVITRAAQIFDRVVVGVVGDPQHKSTLFPIEERVELAPRGRRREITNVEVDVFKDLVVDFARRWDAKVIVKGLRVISDFEWEFQMNQLNRTLAPEIETVYVMASPQVSFVSSSGVKEIASFGGNVDELVPPAVARRLKELFPNGRGGAPLNAQE